MGVKGVIAGGVLTAPVRASYLEPFPTGYLQK